MANSVTIINFHKYLQAALEQRASEIHFAVGQEPLFRVEGRLIPSSEGEVVSTKFNAEIFNHFADDNSRRQLEEEKEVRFAKTLENDTRFIFNAFYQKGNISLSLRLVPSEPLKLDSLGLPGQIVPLLVRQSGLFIICGPYNSGRSTTAAAMIESINQMAARHIVTIEKPIEYLFTGKKSIVEQREVGRDALSFEQALAAVLQDDIDVVYLSEMSKPEVIEKALAVAEAGHLVIAISHAETTAKAIEEIVESCSSNRQSRVRAGLADGLTAIVAQRLVAKIGGGRRLVAELMINNQVMKVLIREGRYSQIQTMIQTSREEGMVSLDQALINLVKEGKIDLNTALSEAQDPETLEKRLKGLV